MIQTIYLNDFRNAFQAAGRGEQFTYDGLGVLFDYLEEFEQDTGEQIELDIIALCCEYAESTPEEIAGDYDLGEHQDPLNYLYANTMVCGTTDDTIIYLQF